MLHITPTVFISPFKVEVDVTHHDVVRSVTLEGVWISRHTCVRCSVSSSSTGFSWHLESSQTRDSCVVSKPGGEHHTCTPVLHSDVCLIREWSRRVFSVSGWGGSGAGSRSARPPDGGNTYKTTAADGGRPKMVRTGGEFPGTVTHTTTPVSPSLRLSLCVCLELIKTCCWCYLEEEMKQNKDTLSCRQEV